MELLVSNPTKKDLNSFNEASNSTESVPEQLHACFSCHNRKGGLSGELPCVFCHKAKRQGQVSNTGPR
jgi:cytochrome c553